MSQWWTWIKQSSNEALALFLPLRCSGCGLADVAVCESCSKQVEVQVQYRELFIRQTQQRIPMWFACELIEPLSSIVRSYKDAGRTSAKSFLSQLIRPLCEDIHRQYPRAVWVVPPSSSKNFRIRGYHPALLLVKKLRMPVVALLANTHRRKDQSLLSVRQRAENMRGAFIATRNLQGAQIVLFDDVMTTGATLRECVRALTSAGANICAIVLLAYTPKKLSENFQENRVTEDTFWD